MKYWVARSVSFALFLKTLPAHLPAPLPALKEQKKNKEQQDGYNSNDIGILMLMIFIDGRHKLGIPGKVLLLVRHALEESRGHSGRRGRDNRGGAAYVQEL